MEIKKQLVNKIIEVKKILEKYDYNLEKVEEILEEINDFRVIIPIIGRFNAGKSSLINCLLGEDLLPTDIIPETAIAAEIKYGENYIKAFKADNSYEIFQFKDIKTISSKEYKYIEVLKDNLELKKNKYTLVDMPGLDSKIEAHNKAIMQYIKKGVFFIAVIDSIEGEIKESLLEFLYELDLYGMDLAIVLNKCEKILPERLKEIEIKVKNTVDSIFERNIHVITASTKAENGVYNLKNLLANINEDNILKNIFSYKICQLIEDGVEILDVIKENAHNDVEEIEEQIESLIKGLNSLEKALDEETKKIKRKFGNSKKNKVIEDLEESLYNNESEIADSLIIGEDTFNRKIVSIIRPIMMNSLNNEIETTFDDIIRDIKIKIDETDWQNERLEVGLSSLSKLIDTTKERLNIEDIIKNSDKFSEIYKSITGILGILTDFVSPLIEVVIVFLPEILNLFGKSREEKIHDKAVEQVRNKIIPKIVDKMSYQIDQYLEEISEAMIDGIRKEIGEKVESQKEMLKKTQQLKKTKEQEFQKYLENISLDIMNLKKLIEF